MVALAICGIFICCYGVQATCPTIKVQLKESFEMSKGILYILHKFIPVHASVKSPFFGLEGDTRQTYFDGYGVSSACSQDNGLQYFNGISFVDYNNETNMIKMQYNDENTIFCNSIEKMAEIVLVDYKDKSHASFYGCKMLMMNGISTKVEGVLIFVLYNSSSLNIIPDALSGLNYTYNILEEQANISKLHLMTKAEGLHFGTNESCKDIKDEYKNCMEINYKKKSRSVKEDVIVILVFSAFCISVIVFGACVQNYSYFI